MSSTPRELGVGDIVTLNSGGAFMTIAENMDGRFLCVWHDKNNSPHAVWYAKSLVTWEQLGNAEPSELIQVWA